MDLTLERPGDHLFIRSVTEKGIQVVDEFYTSSIILSAKQLIQDWPVAAVENMSESDIQPILDLKPEVVLIGCGENQTFLSPRQMMYFYSQNIGVEVMTTDAACRTYNVLVSELRNVAAALIQS